MDRASTTLKHSRTTTTLAFVTERQHRIKPTYVRAGRATDRPPPPLRAQIFFFNVLSRDPFHLCDAVGVSSHEPYRRFSLEDVWVRFEGAAHQGVAVVRLQQDVEEVAWGLRKTANEKKRF